MDLIPSFIARKHGRERVEYPRPAPRADPRADLRRHGLPGAGDADRAGRSAATRSAAPTCCAARWARRRPRRWPSSATSSSRARRRTGSTHGKADEALRPDGEVRRLRLQQVARRRLRAGRLPDGVPQGASSGGVHGGEPVAGHGRHRQGPDPSSTTRVAQKLAILPPDVNASRYRFEPVDEQAASATGWARIKGTGEAAIDGDRRRARRGRAVSRPVRFLPPRRQARGQPARRRSADPRRRVRRDRPAVARRCSRRSASRSTRPSAPRRRRRRCRCSARNGRRAPRGGAVGARVDRRRAAASTKRRARLLPVRASVRRLRRRARAARPHARSRTSSPDATGADRRHRDRAARAGEPRAARWRSSRWTTARAAPRSWSTTRPSTACARCCARTSSSSSRCA